MSLGLMRLDFMRMRLLRRDVDLLLLDMFLMGSLFMTLCRVEVRVMLFIRK